MHIVVDFFRMWLIVKVYKMAYGSKMVKERKSYVFALLLMQAKYKFCSVVFNFNDTIMHLVALISIYFHLKRWQYSAIFFMGFAASIKMSALLYVPGCMLVSAFEYGIHSALIYLIGITIV